MYFTDAVEDSDKNDKNGSADNLVVESSSSPGTCYFLCIHNNIQDTNDEYDVK